MWCLILQLQLFIMKKRSFEPKKQLTYSHLNNSSDSLQYGRPQTFTGSLQTMVDEQVNENRQSNFSKLSKKAVEDLNKQLYQPASYAKAVEYRNERSYMKKTEEGYVELNLLADTEELKYFGLGIYFYIEFFRRMCWLFFAMSLIQGLHIVINFMGDGLNSYQPSFSTYLIRSTLGNYSGASGTELTPYDALLVIGLPALNFLALFIFVLIWRTHIRRTVNKQEEDNTDVKPEKYCIQFEGFNPDELEEQELKKFFSVYGPIYQASYVRSHDDKLHLFEELDQVQEQIQDTELQIALGDGDKQALEQLKKAKQEVQQEINKLSINTFTQSAFVHFQFEKTKVECIDEFNSHYQHSGKCGHCLCRTFCCCCLPKEDEKINFKGNRLFLKTQRVPPPQDINWSSFQLSKSNRFLRAVVAFFIIILFLVFSTAIISLCSLYISANSLDCEGVPVDTYTPATAAATGDPRDLECYCNAYMIESFSDQEIKTACGAYLEGIYVSQSIQYAMIIVSTIANILFGIVLNKLLEYMRPASQQSALKDKTIIYTVFLVINTIIVPVIIYADILGVKPSNYVSIFTIISSDISNFFNVGNLQFYNGFLPIWYKNVSPMFTNYIIFDILMLWIFFVIGKCCCVDKSGLEKKQGKILQKSMNNQITQFKVDASDQISNLFLIMIMVLLFFTGVPILLPLGFFDVLSRYLINRSLIQKNSMRIEGLGENFIQITVGILTFSIIIFSLIGEWMLMANSKVFSTVMNFYGSGSLMFESFFYELKIQLYIPFYIGIAALTVVQLVIYNTVIRFCTNLCSCCAKPIPNYHTRPFSEYSKTMNVLCSYSIRKNDKMKNSVLLIQKYIGQKMNN